MILIHITHRKNLPSIRKHGLLAELATGRRLAVWGCDPDNELWAIAHLLSKGRGWHPRDLVRISFKVDDEAVSRYSEGIYYISEDVTPKQFRSIKTASFKWE